jgi:type VI secretion system secreted protein Hcp
MAVFDAFLKIQGVEGESDDKKLKGQIELRSFSISAQQTGTQSSGGGGGAGRVHFNDITISKVYDKSSVVLMLACATGRHFDEAVITVRKAGGEQEPYLIITLKDVLISSYDMGGHSKEGNLPIIDNFSLNYGSIHKEYKPQTEQGYMGNPVQGGWNLKRSAKI